MGQLKSLPFTSLLLLLGVLPLFASPAGKFYNVGDHVPLFVNKVGPLHNPSETYQYYQLPFCRPEKLLEKKETLGEVLNGDRLANSSYELEFAYNKTRVLLCHKKLNKAEVMKFRDAIVNDFYFQMYYDELPLWAFVGKVEDENWTLDGKGPKYFLFKHVQFDVLYKGNQIMEIHAFSDPNHVVDVTEDFDLDVEFSYSVFWKEISTPYENRMDRYSQASLLPVQKQTHWFSFINSVVIVFLVIGLLAVLFMRQLKNDLRRYSVGDEEVEKEAGWKHIHGDVFRCPANLPLFCAVLGSGTQLLTMSLILFILAFLGVLYPYSRGALSTAIVLSYILTSVVASYIAASFHLQYAEIRWERSIFLSVIVFLAPFLCITFMLNILATYFGATTALPLSTILALFLTYVLFGPPLLLLGGVTARRRRSEFQESSVAKWGPREVPSLAWYLKTPSQMFIAGLLPFSAVALELHHLCTTMWGYKISTLPGILLVTFIMLILLVAMLSVGLTYFQLAMEDHEWCWRSILRGGSTAIFMFAYCTYFYFKSRMSGILQTSFFFGYSACMCYAFFLMLGTISFWASLMFARRIYRGVKRE